MIGTLKGCQILAIEEWTPLSSTISSRMAVFVLKTQ
jgi:hypothetical protein